MSVVPTTSTTLLRDLANDSQHPRWGEFVERYRPMMEAFLHDKFPYVDADDIIQETFVALCKVLPSYRYAPDEEGHFRSYLTGILRNKALRAIRKARQQSDYAEMGKIEVQLQEDDVPAVIADDEQAYRKALFDIALQQFRDDESISDRTKRILERVAINGESPATVAASFKMDRHAVDQAKHWAIARLREIVTGLEAVGNE